MKKFQKINSLQTELKLDKKMDNPQEFTKIYPDDSLVITEKIDGENAQVRNDHGTLLAYSHHKPLSPDNTLNGFYGFVQNHAETIKAMLPEGYSLFGEWLSPHRIKYSKEAYYKWYLFDLYKFDDPDNFDDTATGTYLGFAQVEENWRNAPIDTNIKLVPQYSTDTVLGDHSVSNLADLDEIREALSEQSLLGAEDGREEGIVVAVENRNVLLSDGSHGALRVKCVNEAFKEMKASKIPQSAGQKAVLYWANKYITEPRILKHLLEQQAEGTLPKEISFDWMKGGQVKQLAKFVLEDALEESKETPEALQVRNPAYDKNLKVAQKFANKLTNKVVALRVKGMI